MISRANLTSGPVALKCRDELAPQARWLLDALASMEANGSRFRDRETVQIGWSILTFRSNGTELVLNEPNYAKDPINDTRDDLTTTLTVLAQMRDVLAKTHAEPSFPLYSDKVITAKGALDEADVYLHRLPTENRGDSGWYIAPTADAERADRGVDDLEAIRVYELLRLRPAILRVLALPPEYMAFISGDAIQAVCDSTGEDVWSR